jgi:alkanesulfonate monooxygenase SsuD/methylene tetrahydromethanopterin reductase-like flavin-dependent oxidoreductase (luciferase family)
MPSGTELLYLEDAYLTAFDATVEEVRGDQVRFDRTAFYPTGGGQPFDTGSINEARVVDCIDREAAGVLHVVEGPAPRVGERVRGRGRLFEHKLDVVRRLLAGEAVTAEGPGFRLDGARLGLRPERMPPIWIAANGDRAVQRAGRLGDSWMINPHTRLDELERQVALFHEARAAAGHPPLSGLPITKEICVAESDERAMQVARPCLEAKYAAYVEWGQSDVLPSGDTLRRRWEELTGGGRFLIGSPATVAEMLREHERRLGADLVLCRVQWPGMPHEDAVRSLRLLGERVLPEVAGVRA